MKKYLFMFIALLMLPVVANAKVTLASSIEVDGIGGAPLNANRWNVKLQTTLDYADIKVTPVDDSVTVEGAGRVPIQEGEQDITITLKKGDVTETYVVHMNMVRPKTDTNGNPETGASVPIVLTLIIGTLALISIIVLGSRNKMQRI